MAKAAKKKSGSVGGNPDRKNGKAWKKNKNKPAPQKTEARRLRDFMIEQNRQIRKNANQARRQAEQEMRDHLDALRAEGKALEAAEKAEAARKEQERLDRKARFNKALHEAVVVELDFSDQMNELVIAKTTM